MASLDDLFLPIYHWVAQKATSLESERRLFSRAGLQFGGSDPQSSRPTLLPSGATGGSLGCCDGLFYVSTRMGHGVPRYAVKRYSGCVCGGRFWMRLILESVDWIRKSALLTVGGPYPIS